MVSLAMQKIQIIFFVVLVPAALLYVYLERDNLNIRDFFAPTASVMRINNVPIRVEIASTPNERMRGLSGREELSRIDGLLFVFPEPGYHQIWMKDMLFSIDIIWIDENLQVIGIDKNISPNTYPRLYRPERPAKYILETGVHFSDTYSLREGHMVQLPPKLLE